ncbi:MAG: M17 family peptidase N-terminal domain-containing protein, partial [Nitrosarchaeum sp.]|nr:M17 family peptidase N-terminal domain-containing protein [Nitrosarchaeum sp.]
MKIRVEDLNNSKKKTTMLCGFVLEDSDKVLGLENMDSKIIPSIKQSINDMGGIFGKILVIPTTGRTAAQRILLAGLGKKENFTNDTIRFVSGKIAQKARELKLKEFSIIVPPSSIIEPILSVSQIVEGCKISLYKFEKYKSKKENNIPDITILVSKSEKISKAIKIAEIVSDGAIYTKSIANLPPNECIPATLANFARIISKKNNMKCNIISKNELKKKGFGGITAVGQGSKNEPKLIILEYNHGSRNEKPIVLVGKAVTFDTGGISLKPGEKMDEMKFDKCGGCTVIGIMKAVSELKLPINVVGII